jgi:hypothetical protein
MGESGAVRMVPHTPAIGDAGTPDAAGDAFDFNTTGGAATTSGTNGFGSFGRIYVNYDATNLYVGGTAVALPNDSQNNAYIVFLSGGTNVGSSNLWNYSVSPEGLNKLHNTAYQPPVNIAMLLGDVYGDGTFFNFEMYTNGGFQFGQGVFELVDSTDSIAAVAGAKLSQFGGYGPGSRLAANWECAIPLAAFGVTNASALTNLYLSGLMVTGGTDGDNRFISGKYLGNSATLGNGELPDAWGNFAFSYVNLAGTKVDPPRHSTDTLGVPNSWIGEQLGAGYELTPGSNKETHGPTDREEYFAGLDPNLADALRIHGYAGNRMDLYKVGGHLCHYVLETSTNFDAGAQRWIWSEHSTISSTNGLMTLPTLGASNVMMRIKVRIPAE